MIAGFHMLICFVNDYFKPEWQIKVCDITREVVECLLEEKLWHSCLMKKSYTSFCLTNQLKKSKIKKFGNLIDITLI